LKKLDSVSNVRRPRAVAVSRERDRRVLGLALLAAALLAAALVARARADDDAAPPSAEPFPVAVEQPAKLTSAWSVSYPEVARRDGIAGVVVVAARVGRDGRVRETRIANSVPGLDESAAATVQRYEFSPAVDQGHEVETWVLAPVRFDASLPSGTHGGEAVAARNYSDVEREFESDVEVLRENPPASPAEVSVSDQLTKIMADALQLQTIPAPSDSAIRTFLRGDTLAQSPIPAKRAARKAAWTEVVWLAPWWPMPYRRLASVAISERDFATAAACANVILAARSNDEEALAILKRVGQLKGADPKKKSKT